MRSKLFLFCVCLMCISLNSCSEDDECIDLRTILIGNWENTTQDVCCVEFLMNGTMLDPNDIIISGEINGVVLDEKSWILDENILTVEARKGSQFINIDLAVSSFGCDIMTITQFGFSINLEKL